MPRKRTDPKPPADWRDRVTIDPDVCHGKPCIKGTRIMVSVILDYLQAGEPAEEVLRQYPSREALAIARALAEDRSQGVLLQTNA